MCLFQTALRVSSKALCRALYFFQTSRKGHIGVWKKCRALHRAVWKRHIGLFGRNAGQPYVSRKGICATWPIYIPDTNLFEQCRAPETPYVSRHIGLFGRNAGLFCRSIRLICGNIRLFGKYIGLCCGNKYRALWRESQTVLRIHKGSFGGNIRQKRPTYECVSSGGGGGHRGLLICPRRYIVLICLSLRICRALLAGIQGSWYTGFFSRENMALWHKLVHGSERNAALDALRCNLRSFSAQEPLSIGLFCGIWRIKIRHPMSLRHPAPCADYQT